MITRRTALALAAVMPLMLASPALAMEKFTGEALEAAQKAGKSIIVDVAASWCPVCKAQGAVLETLAKNEKFKDFVFLKVDFDGQKDDLRKLNARLHSTLIAFKGDKEIERVIGETDPAAIEALLTKAL